MISLLLCPICRKPLNRQETVYHCENGHSFDRSSAGYVHLLPANKMHSKDPGDDKSMSAARNRFLSAGHYEPLCRELTALSLRFAPEHPAILDSGCGEGYYTSSIFRGLLQAGRKPSMAGIDLSKHSLRRAAKRERDIEFAVASAYNLPLNDGSVDLLLNCFSPLALEEFRRVLKPGGCFFYVVPGEKHLWEMKTILYETPYLNQEKIIPYEGFEYLDIRSVDCTIHLNNRQEIEDLFGMTPYFWKTPREGMEKLSALESLDVTIAFRIHVFRKTVS